MTTPRQPPLSYCLIRATILAAVLAAAYLIWTMSAAGWLTDLDRWIAEVDSTAEEWRNF